MSAGDTIAIEIDRGRRRRRGESSRSARSTTRSNAADSTCCPVCCCMCSKRRAQSIRAVATGPVAQLPVDDVQDRRRRPHRRRRRRARRRAGRCRTAGRRTSDRTRCDRARRPAGLSCGSTRLTIARRTRSGTDRCSRDARSRSDAPARRRDRRRRPRAKPRARRRQLSQRPHGAAVADGIVAAVREPVVEAQRQALPDDVGLRQRSSGARIAQRPSLDAGARRERRQPLERREVSGRQSG